MSTLTRSQIANADTAALLRARNTLLWFSTREEVRVERAIIEAAGAAGYETVLWDCASGLTDADGKPVSGGPALADPNAMLAFIRDNTARRVYVLRDLHKWLDPVVLRALRSLARNLQGVSREEARAIVVLTPSGDVPPELSGHATVIDYPLPERPEIAAILDDVIRALPPEIAAQAAPNGTREAAIDAAVGLTAEEAASCYAKSLVTLRRIDPKQVSTEKKRVIAREKVLTWYDPDPRGMAAIGGLDLLKVWLTAKRATLSPKARERKIPPPKGLFLVGPPGTGKSLTAKACAAAWGVPLLRLDLGALKSKYVGESEANIRKALATAEAVAPAVVWIDEIEKSLAGSTGPQGDGGVSADALGTVLSWMQERTAPVFVVATANDVRALPPELLRSGRFDAVFWVDLPTTVERVAVLSATLAQFEREASALDLAAVAAATPGFVGAELAAIVPDAMCAAFADGDRDMTTADLIAAAAAVVPLSKSAAEKINGLREWAQGRARPASAPESRPDAGGGRKIDL